MPRKRKAQQAARNREESKRIAREVSETSVVDEILPSDEVIDSPEVDLCQIGCENDTCCEYEDDIVDCISSSSEDCSELNFDYFSSTAMDRDIDSDFMGDEWSTCLDWSDGVVQSDLSAGTIHEHGLPVAESTINHHQTTQFLEEQWISDLSNVPLLAAGGYPFICVCI